MNIETKNYIWEEYCNNKKSGLEIAKELNIPISTLYQMLDKAGIKTRNPNKARLNYLKKKKLGRYKRK